MAIWYLGARIAPGIGSNSPIMRLDPPTEGTMAPSIGGNLPAVQLAAPASESSNPIIAYPTLEGLFGSLDFCTCRECRSILSPAAYLVDLLHYLDQLSPTQGYQNPQKVLFGRRPDIQYLPLTCENTNTALPYIDIVNETLEYFVVNNHSLAGYEGHDTGDGVASDELMASPQYVNDAAYTTLQKAYFPPPLPFNRPLEVLRLHLQKLGVALRDVMVALRKSDAIDSDSPTDYGWRDILMEQLGISRDEYRLFTDSSLGLHSLYGYPIKLNDPDPNNTVLTGFLQPITLQEFSRRTSVSYDDVFSIIKTQFVNPNSILISRIERLNASFATLQSLNDPDPAKAAANAAAFKNALPFGLDPRQYGGLTPTDDDAVVNWVKRNLPRITNIITITNPDPVSDVDQCSGNTLQFRYSNPDNTTNKLSATDFVKLIRFIRLWRKLGLSIGQTDELLLSLFPASDMPSGTNDAANLQLLDQGFVTFVSRAGFLFQMMRRLGLSADAALFQLLACWAPISTVGNDALYKRMVLTPTLLQDAGGQMAMIGAPISAGDVLTTTINTVEIPYTAQAGDTPATIATNIANTINGTSLIDPTINVPLNWRIHADVSGSNANYVPLRAAVAALATANQQAVDPFFSTYPELQPVYDAYVASSDPPAAKRTTLLANFLPSLKHKRKQEEALASVTAAAGTDQSFANALLQDATILHAAADPTLAAIVDLTAIEFARALDAAFSQ